MRTLSEAPRSIERAKLNGCRKIIKVAAAARQKRERKRIFMAKIFSVSYGMNRDCANPKGAYGAEAIRSTKVHPMAAGAVIFSYAGSGMRQR